MRIDLLAVGSRGVVQPVLALGAGLNRAGYDVALVAFEEFRPLIERCDLDFIPLSGDVQRFLNQNPGNKTFTGTVHFRRRRSTAGTLSRLRRKKVSR